MAIDMFNFLLSHICISCGRCVYDPDYFIFIISMKFTFFRDCTATQGRNCKGAAVNFGGWDEFTIKNGVFRFPESKLKINWRIDQMMAFAFLYV